MTSINEGKKVVVKFAQSLVGLTIALIVLFAALSFLHNRFGSNVIGKVAGQVGDLATGQKYNFNN